MVLFSAFLSLLSPGAIKEVRLCTLSLFSSSLMVRKPQLTKGGLPLPPTLASCMSICDAYCSFMDLLGKRALLSRNKQIKTRSVLICLFFSQKLKGS